MIPVPRDLRPGRSWHASASCNGTDSDLWILDAPDQRKPIPRLCQACPVELDCHREALLDIIEGLTGADLAIRAGRRPEQLAKDARRWRRTLALALIEQGETIVATAEIIGVSVRTIQRWVAA